MAIIKLQFCKTHVDLSAVRQPSKLETHGKLGKLPGEFVSICACDVHIFLLERIMTIKKHYLYSMVSVDS